MGTKRPCSPAATLTDGAGPRRTEAGAAHEGAGAGGGVGEGRPAAHAGPRAPASCRFRRRPAGRTRYHSNGGPPPLPGAAAPRRVGWGGAAVARKPAAAFRLRGAVSRLPPFTYFSPARREVGEDRSGGRGATWWPRGPGRPPLRSTLPAGKTSSLPLACVLCPQRRNERKHFGIASPGTGCVRTVTSPNSAEDLYPPSERNPFLSFTRSRSNVKHLAYMNSFSVL